MKRMHVNRLFIGWAILFLCTGVQATPEVKIHYLGHSSFILEFDNGVTVLTDYGTSNCWGLSSPIYDIGDFVPTILTYSHRHDDHYNEDRKPASVEYQLEEMDSLDIDGLSIRPVRLCEGVIGLGTSTAFIFDYKGFSICHLGDAQGNIMAINNENNQNTIRSLFPEQFDLLLMTIEGVDQFIPEAAVFLDFLQPKRAIPMHYWSEEYKTQFLEYLKLQNTTAGTNFKTVINNSSEFYLSSREIEVFPIMVASLSPSAINTLSIDSRSDLKMPGVDCLIRNYPNPFNPETTFYYTLNRQGPVTISIFNMIGELVEILVDRPQEKGEYSVLWNAENYPSGIYLYRLQTDNFSQVKRCMLIK